MRTLRNRLTFTHALVAVIAVLIVAALATGLILQFFGNLAERQARDQAAAAARQVAALYLRQGGWDGAVAQLSQQVEQGRGRDFRRLQVRDLQGRVLYDSAGEAASQFSARLPRSVEVPVVVRRQMVGSVVVGGPRGLLTPPERDFLSQVYSSVLLGSALAGAVALAVGLLITRRVTRPIGELTLAARRLAAGERHEPIALPAEAELAELAHAFNTMAEQLAHQEQLRRQMVADIAHELRTPLSVLRLHVESLEDGVAQPTPAVLAALGLEVGLLARLIDDLRLLSLADAGQLSLAVETVDPLRMLERAAAMALPQARRKGIELRVEHAGALPPVRADVQRLAQVLGNLIENALRYTPDGGQVTLRAGIAARQVLFEVSDTGSGIAPEDLPHIFNRFYRADRARSRETGGSGLGLAIVQRLVESQGGQVAVASALGQGTTFTVQLPAASPS